MIARLVATFAYVAAALLAAAGTHVALVLFGAGALRDRAFGDVRALAPLGTPVAAPAPTSSGGPFATRDPATSVAVCRYDLAQGPMRIVATFQPGDLGALSFHDSGGDVYFALNDGAAADRRLAAVVGTAEQLKSLAQSDAPGALAPELRLEAPSPQGFALARAIGEADRDAPAGGAALAALKCGPAATRP
ncbi:MAG: hypothetical protein KGI57_13080 [Hyphomicrobiales bacterium]|nr:hypothetical protein [Hyphomicrobiales bacterium]